MGAPGPGPDPTALRASPLFSELGRRDLAKVARAMGRRRFAPGEVVVVEGELGAGFFVVETGRAQVTVGGRRVRALGPGDHFGRSRCCWRSRGPPPSRRPPS